MALHRRWGTGHQITNSSNKKTTVRKRRDLTLVTRDKNYVRSVEFIRWRVHYSKACTRCCSSAARQQLGEHVLQWVYAEYSVSSARNSNAHYDLRHFPLPGCLVDWIMRTPHHHYSYARRSDDEFNRNQRWHRFPCCCIFQVSLWCERRRRRKKSVLAQHTYINSNLIEFYLFLQHYAIDPVL